MCTQAWRSLGAPEVGAEVVDTVRSAGLAASWTPSCDAPARRSSCPWGGSHGLSLGRATWCAWSLRPVAASLRRLTITEESSRCWEAGLTSLCVSRTGRNSLHARTRSPSPWAEPVSKSVRASPCGTPGGSVQTKDAIVSLPAAMDCTSPVAGRSRCDAKYLASSRICDSPVSMAHAASSAPAVTVPKSSR